MVHHPALQVGEAPEWYRELQRRDGMASSALEFLALTAARSGEVRGATWDEIDLECRLWTIPAARMKANKVHRVPLTQRTVHLLASLPRFAESRYTFAAPRGGQLSDASLGACMRRIHLKKTSRYYDRTSGRPAVPHGLRSTFRDWAAERTTFPREMVEIALAHTVGSDVERAYRRSDMLAKRRDLMSHWEDFLAGVRGGA